MLVVPHKQHDDAIDDGGRAAPRRGRRGTCRRGCARQTFDDSLGEKQANLQHHLQLIDFSEPLPLFRLGYGEGQEWSIL
jgi:hypothetical protein